MLIIIGGISINHSLDKIKNDTQQYLVKDQGYKNEDIKEIKSYYNWAKGWGFHTNVIFKDEPDGTYYYAYNSKKCIYQEGFTSKTSKHAEINN
ncbi:DUF3139 domain-containing protein [Paenibacillus polymyxa]|nr:DUF3139 domain-containing protein [Paenibacillus polymyxa]